MRFNNDPKRLKRLADAEDNINAPMSPEPPPLGELEALRDWLESDDREATGETLDKAVEKVKNIIERTELLEAGTVPGQKDNKYYAELVRQRDELSVLLSKFFAGEPFNEKNTIVDCVRHIINRLSMAEGGIKSNERI